MHELDRFDPLRERKVLIERMFARDRAAFVTQPGEVYNMDSRAGGATEADESGTSIKAIQGALTHSKADTTLRYIRRRSTKIAEVAAARSSKRAADHGDGTV